MCGICGYISTNKISEDALQAMNDTMYHRGPNDAGLEIFDAGSGYVAGFAQRRLSINDLSPLGHQPMHDVRERLTVVFNGEIYNFLELKQELAEYPFHTGCDTEAILAAYYRWGENFVDHIKGMFAIVLFDKETGTFIFARDRIGKKPLYYWLEDGNIVFASELKPILACPGFKREIRTEVLSRYLYHQYINAPETIYRNVYKLEPGAVMTFKAGKVHLRKYWDIAKVYEEQSKNPVENYEEAKAGLKKRLIKAVSDRMIADVPLGSFLSGGYDSSLVTAIAASLSEGPVKTFSIGFNEKNYDESPYARAVAEHLGTDHTELIIDEATMYDLVDSIPKYFDEPFADSSQIPTMLVSGLAKQRVTVALSGDGGDEFFCGYNNYVDVAKAQQLDLLGAAAYAAGKIPLGKSSVYDKYPFKVKVIAANRDPETKTQFSSDGYMKATHAFLTGREEVDARLTAAQYAARDFVTYPCRYPMESRYKTNNWQTKRMLLDMDTYLPGDILCKVDRAAMKYSLESRCPILDTDVTEYSFRIPHKFKYANGDKKHILKDIAYDYIPKELLERPKVGFGVPLDKWMRGPLREQLLAYADPAYLKRQGIFDADYVSNFVTRYLTTGDAGPSSGANYSKIAWPFFVFQQWYEYYEKH